MNVGTCSRIPFSILNKLELIMLPMVVKEKLAHE